MNEQNLIQFDKLTESQQREIRSKGGRASVKAKRQRKAIKTAILEAIYAETETGSTELEEMIGGMIRRVKKTGDPGTFEKIMEYVGKSPKDKREEEELKLYKHERRTRSQIHLQHHVHIKRDFRHSYSYRLG